METPRRGDGDPPLVSMGLPVFNGARFLEPCLDSVLAQTYPYFELIISDNASTDDTGRICERYAGQDTRVRYQRSGCNRGSAWNHNRVRELARGSYFRWCGDDDIIHPRFLEACVDALERWPDAVLAYALTVVIDDAGEPIDRTVDRLDLQSSDPAVRFGSLLRGVPWTLTPFYGLMRTAATADVRPIGTFLANDRSFLAELALRGQFVRVEDYLMFRRRHAEHREWTREAEQRFMDPARGTGYWMREWRMLREHITSVARAPVGVRRKLELLQVVGGWAIDQRESLTSEIRGLAGYLARRVGLRRHRTTS